MTIVLTTHLLEEADRADRIAILNAGQLVAFGSADELRATVGGDSITIVTADPPRLAQAIQDRFGCAASVLEGGVRLEQPDGHQWIARLVEAFPGQIDSVTLGKPTLEDVFIDRTGHRFWTTDSTAKAEQRRPAARRRTKLVPGDQRFPHSTRPHYHRFARHAQAQRCTCNRRRRPRRTLPLAGGGHAGRREWVRFVRQRNRVVGAIGQPLIFWLLFGAGLGPSFRLPGAGDESVSYREYFFPGSLVLILLFTAIFATISIIEDRREGFLQSVLVAPVPRWSMVLGKILGGTLLAMAQGLIFLVLGLTLGVHVSLLGLLAIVALLFVMAIGLTALGFVIAWRMDSTQGSTPS